MVIAFSIHRICLMFFKRVQGRALVPLSNHTLYRDDKHFSNLVEDNEDREKVAKKQVVVFSYPSPIYFANTDR